MRLPFAGLLQPAETSYTSYEDIRADLYKHVRKPNGPMAIYKHPMTLMQARIEDTPDKNLYKTMTLVSISGLG